MTFQIKHTKQSLFGSSSFKTLTIFLLFFILVLIFNFSNSVHSMVSKILSPLFDAGDHFYKNIGQIPKNFSSRDKIMEENNSLLDEIENNRISLIDYESLKYENQQLRQELGIKPAGNSITVAVLARSPQVPLDSLILDKGSTHGLNNGDLVLSGERILVGKIVKLSENRSTVALNSFAGVISYGYVARTSEPLQIRGNGGGCIEAEVPIDFDIVVGDKILVSGTLTYFVAVVGMVEEDQSSGLKKIFMSLPVDISKINMMFVEPSIKE